MLQIDITNFFKNDDPYHYSNSFARSGNRNIGRETWQNARAAKPLLAQGQVEEAREYFAGLASEWRALPDSDIQALFIQEVSAQIQELEPYRTGPFAFDWRQYRRDALVGRISGNLFKFKQRLYISLTH